DERGNFPADDLAVGIQHLPAPPLAEGRNHLGIAEHVVPHLVGIQHNSSAACKSPSDSTLAARYAANDAQDIHLADCQMLSTISQQMEIGRRCHASMAVFSMGAVLVFR